MTIARELANQPIFCAKCSCELPLGGGGIRLPCPCWGWSRIDAIKAAGFAVLPAAELEALKRKVEDLETQLLESADLGRD